MSEEKNKKEEKEVKIAATEAKKDKQKTKKGDKPEEIKSGEVAGLEELPEEIKKKLEKKKNERSAKEKRAKKKKKKKTPRRVTVGKAYIKATYNNTIVTLADLHGNVLSWASAGVAGFKGPKKATPYAAQIISRIAVGKAREKYGLEEVSVLVKGVGTGRESAIRALHNNGLIITSIKDITPIPHNGCRPRKPRRV
jgi:small subunit ribosomal protein S11